MCNNRLLAATMRHTNHNPNNPHSYPSSDSSSRHYPTPQDWAGTSSSSSLKRAGNNLSNNLSNNSNNNLSLASSQSSLYREINLNSGYISSGNNTNNMSMTEGSEFELIGSGIGESEGNGSPGELNVFNLNNRACDHTNQNDPNNPNKHHRSYSAGESREYANFQKRIG